MNENQEFGSLVMGSLIAGIVGTALVIALWLLRAVWWLVKKIWKYIVVSGLRFGFKKLAFHFSRNSDAPQSTSVALVNTLPTPDVFRTMTNLAPAKSFDLKKL